MHFFVLDKCRLKYRDLSFDHPFRFASSSLLFSIVVFLGYNLKCVVCALCVCVCVFLYVFCPFVMFLCSFHTTFVFFDSYRFDTIDANIEQEFKSLK